MFFSKNLTVNYLLKSLQIKITEHVAWQIFLRLKKLRPVIKSKNLQPQIKTPITRYMFLGNENAAVLRLAKKLVIQEGFACCRFKLQIVKGREWFNIKRLKQRARETKKSKKVNNED